MSSSKIAMSTLATAVAAGLLVTGCAAPPAQDSADKSKNKDFQACMVTDSGGIDDRSFNAGSWKGLQDAQKDLGIKAKYVQSKTDADYAPNIQQMTGGECGLVVTVGFMLGDATKAAATKFPDQKFAIVDFAYDQPLANVRPLTFDTSQAAFLAGYAAASASKTGTVATFGGIQLPTVTVFMDGFAAGVKHFNQAKNKQVKVLGWDEVAQKGSFTGDFKDQNKGENLANTLHQQGADVIMPVAGPVGMGAAEVALRNKTMVIGVDQDWFESAPKYKDVVLTSVVKRMDVAVMETAKIAANGEFSGKPFVGTLANNGVGIASFHAFEGKLDKGLQAELDALKADIASGKLKVVSKSAPKS